MIRSTFVVKRFYSCPSWITNHLPLPITNSDNSQPIQHISYILKLSKRGNISELSRVIHEHYDALNVTEVFMVNLIVTAWCRSKSKDKWQRIHGMFLDAKKYNQINGVVMATYLDACGFCGSLNSLNEVWRYFNDKKSYMLNSNHYNSYIQALMKLKQENDAFEALKLMPSHKIKSKTLVTFMDPLLKSDNKLLLNESWKWIEDNGLFKTCDKQESSFTKRWGKLVHTQTRKRFLKE